MLENGLRNARLPNAVGHARSPRVHSLVTALFGRAALSLLLVASACAGPGPAEPVAVPSFEVTTTHVSIGSPVQATLTFSVLPNAVFDEEYRVFLHFLRDDGTLMWTADHAPPRPTTEWRPGDTIEYTRTFLVPLYPYLGDAEVSMGLYSPEDGTRLPLDGDHVGQQAYRVGGLTLLPQAENIPLRYGSGWHGLEHDAIGGQWRWSEKVGVIRFDNPRKDALLYLNLSGLEGWNDEPQTLTVLVGDRLADRFAIEPGDLVQEIPLSASLLGDTKEVELRLAVDRTFVPALLTNLDNPDRRALGVRVLQAYLVSQ